MRLNNYNLKHLRMSVPAPLTYRTPHPWGTEPDILERRRQQHAEKLRAQLRDLESSINQLHVDRVAIGYNDVDGVLVTVKGVAGHDIPAQQLQSKRDQVDVINLGKTAKQEPLAVIRLGQGEISSLSKKVNEYESKETKKGKPRHNHLISNIEEIKRAMLEDLWVGPKKLLPLSNGNLEWWEIWLVGGTESPAFAQQSRDTFALFTKNEGVIFKPDDRIEFADRQVFLIQTSFDIVSKAVSYLDCVAELHPPSRGVRDFIVSQTRSNLHLEFQANRLVPPKDDAPTITLLDTGLSSAHPFLRPAVRPNGLHTIEPSSNSTGDYKGHGTEMAGIALYEDLSAQILSNTQYQLPAYLESVRIKLASEEERKLWGKITSDAVTKPESVSPDVRRIFCMTFTGESLTLGKPSSWSAKVDQLCFNSGQDPRLIAIAAGNINTIDFDGYPSRNLATSIDDPGQARNAITVGAMTNLHDVLPSDDGINFEPIAQPGQLSPHSRSHLPQNDVVKPDIVCEGGNVAWDGQLADWYFEGLSLLTTHHDFLKNPFTLTWATSPATANAARVMAQIWGTNPTLKPETVRGLLIHSASWTSAMHEQFPNKHDLLRSCGYGVPDVEFACRSAKSAVTLIAEGRIRALHRDRIKTRKGHKWSDWKREVLMFELPWPQSLLLAMGETKVELRVTLSYFCDPNPKQTLTKYQGASLQWDLQGHAESDALFMKRVNAAERGEGDRGFNSSRDWKIGITARSMGTVQSDRWSGTAADLSARRQLAVYPVNGWWDNNRTKYSTQEIAFSLIVSVRSEDTTVDIYNPISLSASIET